MKEYFYTITESMLDLGLRGTELNLFAVIYGYSQRGDGVCYAKREELARRCGVNSRRTIDAALSSLIEKGLIKKHNIKKDDTFLTAYAFSGEGAKIAQGGANSAPQGVQILHREGANSAPKEIKGKTNSENIPPTPQEVADYVRARGWTDPDGFGAFYVEINNNRDWKDNRGRPIKAWKNNICSAWEPRRKFDTFTVTPRHSAPTPQSPAPTVAQEMTDAEYWKLLQNS